MLSGPLTQEQIVMHSVSYQVLTQAAQGRSSMPAAPAHVGMHTYWPGQQPITSQPYSQQPQQQQQQQNSHQQSGTKTVKHLL